MANILIYYPYNLRSVEQQSVMEMLVKKGHKVTLLTSCERGYIHDYVKKFGVSSESVAETPVKFLFYKRNLAQLNKIIKQYNIEIVIAHQQIPAIIAGALKKIRKFKLVYVRHNSDESYSDHPFKAKWLNKIANWLTPVKVAPSSVVKNFWISKEHVSESQIIKINYGYNFDQYEKPVAEEVENIRHKFPAEILVLSIARLMPVKRHKEMFKVIKHFSKQGTDIKMLCLGTGSFARELKEEIRALEMENTIFMLGRKNNVFDYIKASDIFIHLSYSEASNSSVKEVGLCSKPVIVCMGVGDFEDYITDAQTGFLVPKNNPVDGSINAFARLIEDKNFRVSIGEQLNQTILKTFDINRISDDYDSLLNFTISNS